MATVHWLSLVIVRIRSIHNVNTTKPSVEIGSGLELASNVANLATTGRCPGSAEAGEAEELALALCRHICEL